MTTDPKQFLRHNSTPLGLVENDQGREIIRFEDAVHAPCSLSTGTVSVEPAGLNIPGVQLEPSVRLTHGQAEIVLNAAGVKALAETLQRWLDYKSFIRS